MTEALVAEKEKSENLDNKFGQQALRTREFETKAA